MRKHSIHGGALQPPQRPKHMHSGIFLDRVRTLWAVMLILLIVAVFLVASNLQTMEQQDEEPAAESRPVTVDLFVMSKCPYGLSAERSLFSLERQLGDQLKLNLHYISTDLRNGSFVSLHGESETKGNIIQLCLLTHESARAHSIIECMNKDPRKIPDNWLECSDGISTEKIIACAKGNEGAQLLSNSAREAAESGAGSSPTIFVDGQRYQGGRNPSDLLRKICERLSEQPAVCTSVEVARVNLIILNDEQCTTCVSLASNLALQLGARFPNLEVTYIDYQSPEGRQLYTMLNVTELPILVFDESILESPEYSSMERYLDETNGFYKLRTKSTHNPSVDST